MHEPHAIKPKKHFVKTSGYFLQRRQAFAGRCVRWQSQLFAGLEDATCALAKPYYCISRR
jgi:hypothetical protein